MKTVRTIILVVAALSILGCGTIIQCGASGTGDVNQTATIGPDFYETILWILVAVVVILGLIVCMMAMGRSGGLG